MTDFKNILNKFEFLKTASSLSSEMNLPLYIVGGYVRDLILGKQSNEIDFLVVGDGTVFAKEFSERLGVKNISIFKNFGTAHFKYENIDLEFVGARKESYKKNSRNPEVTLGSFKDDISRRDFTINTLAISLTEKDFGKLIDLYSGLKDIKNKIIRTPLDPLITFSDDPLRILRAFRFAAQLQFNVADNVISASEKLSGRLRIISQERITDEFFKILSSPKPSIGLNLLFKSGVLSVIFPEISNLKGVEQRKDFHHKDVFLHTCQVVDNISRNTSNVWLRFAALVHDIAKPQTKKFVEGTGWTFHGHEELGARMMKGIFKKLKLPFRHLPYIEKLVRLHLRPIALASDQVTDSAIRRLIVAAGDDIDDLITLCRSDITSKNPDKVSKYLNNYERVVQKIKEVEQRDELRSFHSPVKGEEIMKICGIPPSKKVGLIKSAIEEAILSGKINNDYKEALEYLYKIKDSY